LHPLDTNSAAMMQIMQQIISQISDLIARVEKVKTKETTTTTTAANNAPAILISTPAANINYTYKLKGLKDPNAFNSTRS
jgi:hypothetical protein